MTDKSAANLMVVLRESMGGAPRKTEGLDYLGKAKVKLADGREVDVNLAAYAFLGDMHIRFVFDEPTSMLNASSEDLERLNLTPEQALELAVGNVRRVYGPAKVVPFAGGLLAIESRSPDLTSSFFLDKEFWAELAKKHAEGIVAAVPKRGGLVFAPLSNEAAVTVLRKGVAYLYTSSERMRVSSALYLFKDGRWSLFQGPAK